MAELIDTLEESEFEDDDVSLEIIPSLYNMELNYANANKWYAYFPLEEYLGNLFKNLNLHITRFSIPQLDLNSSTVSYRGYEKELPLKVLNPSTKLFTLEYIVDSDWTNYKCLYNFMSGLLGVLNPKSTDLGEKTDTIDALHYIPLRIYLLGPYKKKIILFHFSNCWIKSFGDILLDVADSNEVMHSFTCVFDEFTIENC